MRQRNTPSVTFNFEATGSSELHQKNVTQNMKKLIRCIINNVTKGKKGQINREEINGYYFFLLN
jgi:hypothetical protein